jgi:hypothetical protein
MNSPFLRTLATIASVCAGGIFVAAVGTAAAGAPGPAAKAPGKPAMTISVPGSAAGAANGARGTLILGTAWNPDNTPISAARLRLRNVLSGRIDATTVAIELVTDSGKLLTVGHTFTVGPGETVATFIRLGTKVPWFDKFFSNAASAVSSAAAATGVTAMAPEKRTCVSACAGQ